MNKRFSVLLVLIALVLVSSHAFAGLLVTPNCKCVSYCDAPRVTHTEYKCGDCTNNWSQECRTLYKYTYYSNCTHSVSPVETKSVEDKMFCYNGSFHKFNYSRSSWQCRKNPVTGKIDSYEDFYVNNLPPGFRWSKSTSLNHVCEYGCNQSTGRCYDTPSYKYECQGSYKVKIDERCGNVVSREYCQYGCNNGECMAKPSYKYECQGSYKVKIDERCGNVVSREYCQYGCSGEACQGRPAPSYNWGCSADKTYKYVENLSTGTRQYSKCPAGTKCEDGACLKTATFEPAEPKEPVSTGPRYEYKCSKPLFSKYEKSTRTDTETGQKKTETCYHGCNQETGQCIAGPRYVYDCKWSLFRGSYSERLDTYTGEKCQTKCPNGCSQETGQCKAETTTSPGNKCTPSNRTYCGSDGKTVYIEYTYGDCTTRSFLKTTCGSCQVCEKTSSGASCEGPVGSCSTTKFSYTARYSTSRSTGTGSASYSSNNAGSYYTDSSAKASSSTSAYSRHYTRSGSSAAASASVSRYGRSYPSSSAGTCTYNSDCGYGNYCDRGTCRRA